MKITVGDLWAHRGFRVIPTNCSVNSLGHAVCGRGTAGQAAIKFRGFKSELGRRLKRSNRAPEIHILNELELICFPVKKYWSDKANLQMIRTGLTRLVELADELPTPIYLPLLGCGFGELEESKVLPILEEYLDDRFILVKRAENVVAKYPRSFESGIRKDRSLERELQAAEG